MINSRINESLLTIAHKTALTSKRLKKSSDFTGNVQTFRAFEYINYRFLWLSTAFFSGGFWLQQIVIGWLAYNITQSALITSIVMGLDALPILLGAPLGGVISEKFDKKKLIIGVYIYQAILSSSFGIIVLIGQENIWNLFTFVFLMGISWTINDPCRISLLASIIPKDRLVNAFALNSMAFSIMRLVVPAVGGILIAFVGVGPLFFIQSSLILVASAVLCFIKTEKNTAKRESFSDSIKTIYPDLKFGLKFAIGQPVIVGLTFTTFLMMILIMPFVQGLMPVYAAQVFNSGPERLGLLLSAAGIGSFVATVFIASLKQIERPGKIIFLILGLIVISMISMSQNSNYYIALGIVMLLSGCMMSYFSISSATLQRFLPNDVRSRVTGLYMMVWGFIPIGSLAAGFIANVLGPQIATLTGALILVSIATGAVFLCKELWQHNSETAAIYREQTAVIPHRGSYKAGPNTETA